MLAQACLSEHRVGRVARFDGVVHHEVDARHRRAPDIVIASAVANELASGFTQQPDDLRREAAVHDQCTAFG